MTHATCRRCLAYVVGGRLHHGSRCFTGIPGRENEECILDLLDRGREYVHSSEESEAKPTVGYPHDLSQPKADGGGLRFNAGKNRLDLIPPEWPWALGDVTTKGSYKYEERNWERGMKWSIMIGCALRHIYKFAAGERYDPETGCHHLAMAAWNVLALMSYDLRRIGENDMASMGTAILGEVNNGNPTHPKIREALGLPVEK